MIPQKLHLHHHYCNLHVLFKDSLRSPCIFIQPVFFRQILAFLYIISFRNLITVSCYSQGTLKKHGPANLQYSNCQQTYLNDSYFTNLIFFPFLKRLEYFVVMTTLKMSLNSKKRQDQSIIGIYLFKDAFRSQKPFRERTGLPQKMFFLFHQHLQLPYQVISFSLISLKVVLFCFVE